MRTGWGLIIVAAVVGWSLAGCEDSPGTEGAGAACAEADLVAQCPPGSSPLLGTAGEELCQGQAGVDIVGGEGSVTGRCVGSGRCVVACQFASPCACGVAAVTREGVFCVPCEGVAVCGNGVCEGGETPENCPQDCSPDCTAGQSRCASLRVREECNQRGRWDEVACLPSEVCDASGGAVCRRADVLVGEEGVVVDEAEPPPPGRLLPDRGSYPGVGAAVPTPSDVELVQVASHRFCRSTDPGAEDCPWVERAGTTGGFTNYSDVFTLLPGPGSGFRVYRSTSGIGSTTQTPMAREVRAVGPDGLLSDVPAPVELLEHPELDGFGPPLGGAMGTADGRWLLARTASLVDGRRNSGDDPPRPSQTLVRVDLEDHSVTRRWNSGQRAVQWAGGSDAETGRQLAEAGSALWTTVREVAWRRVGAGAAATGGQAAVPPDVLVRVDLDLGEAEAFPQLQAPVDAAEPLVVAVDPSGRVGAITFRYRHNVRWIEVWNLEDRERILTILSQPPNLLVQEARFTGRADELLVYTEGSGTQAVRAEVWDLAERQIRVQLSQRPGTVSPSGDVAVRVNVDNATLEVVDPVTGVLLTSRDLAPGEGFPDASGPVRVVLEPVFSGDGTRVMVAVAWGNDTLRRFVQVYEVLR